VGARLAPGGWFHIRPEHPVGAAPLEVTSVDDSDASAIITAHGFDGNGEHAQLNINRLLRQVRTGAIAALMRRSTTTVLRISDVLWLLSHLGLPTPRRAPGGSAPSL